MATARQLARARASLFDRQYRLSIGPQRAYVTASLVTIGAPVTLPVEVKTTSWLNASSTTVPVTTTAGYPSSGMLLVGGLSWGRYTGKTSTSFTGWSWQRGPTEWISGVSVVAWHDITSLVTSPPVIEEWEEFPYVDWRCPLVGVSYNSDVLAPDATVLIEQRLTPDGAFGTYTSWIVAALGYVREWRSEGDKDGNRPWSATVESVGTYLKPHRITSRTYGRVNLATGASVTASGALGDPSLEPGEFAGGVGSTDADNLVDDNPDTRYVSALAPTTTTEAAGSGGAALIVEEVYTRGPLGAPKDLQYIVIRWPTWDSGNAEVDGEAVRQVDEHFKPFLSTKATTWTTRHRQPDGEWERRAPTNHYIRLPQHTFTRDAPLLILCRNREVFERHFGVDGFAAVYDWRFLPGIGGRLPAADVMLDPKADVIHIRNGAHLDVQKPAIIDMVAWGAIADSAKFVTDNDTAGVEWPSGSGNNVAIWAAGASIRRRPPQTDTNAVGDWAVEDTPIPGNNRLHTEPIYVSLDLGQFEVTLDGEHLTGSNTITVNDATPLDSFGTIQIDNEQIDYTSRTGTVLTLAGTTAADHADGATVYQVDAALGAHRLYAVSSLEIVRQRVLGGDNLPIVPKYVELWGSTEASPAYPGTSNYSGYWLGRAALVSAANHTLDTRWILGLTAAQNDEGNDLNRPPASRRLRHLMLKVREMSDGGRVKLNELKVWRSQAAASVDAASPPSDGDDFNLDYRGVLFTLLREVLAATEIAINRIPNAALGPELTLVEGALGDALGDLLAKSLAVLRFELDGTVTVQAHPTHPLAPRPTIKATLTPEMVRSPHTATTPSLIQLGQMIVEIDDPWTDAFYTGRFPPTPAAGEIRRETLQMHVGSSVNAAQVAQALFVQDERNARRFSGTTVGPAEWLHVGDRVLLYDYSDAAGVRLVNCRITAVAHGESGVESWEAIEWHMP